jgi:uncharacterized protein
MSHPFPLLALFVLASLMANAQDFAAGLAAYKKGDYVTAVKQWRPLAEGGDAAVQYNLALLYLDGHGVPQNYAEAVDWFKRSADQGYNEAQHDLGAMYASGKGVRRDYVEAYKWMNICAAKGNAGCISQRDLLAKKLKRPQLEQAQRLATEFHPQKETAKQ